MRSPKEAILVTGLFAALVVVVLAWYVSNLPKTPASPAPEAPAAEEGTPPDSGRLMAPSEKGLSLYTDSKLDFFLYYPEGITPITDPGQMANLGYIPTCDPDHASVCFPYDPSAYADTNFESSAFSVHLRSDLGTEAECHASQPAENAAGAVMLGDTVFTAFEFGDAAMSHRLDGRNYRAWHAGNCYELATRLATSVYEVWEPGTIRKFTLADEASVRAVLDKMLLSFRFQEDLERL